MNGLFFVNDPGNVTDPNNQTALVHNYFGMDYLRHGFNELDLRQKDLCKLVQIDCTPINIANVFDLITNLSHKPLSE